MGRANGKPGELGTVAMDCHGAVYVGVVWQLGLEVAYVYVMNMAWKDKHQVL